MKMGRRDAQAAGLCAEAYGPVCLAYPVSSSVFMELSDGSVWGSVLDWVMGFSGLGLRGLSFERST